MLEHVAEAVVLGKSGVGFRIPHLVVDAVHDAAELPVVITQVVLKPLAVFRGLYLIGIGPADGCDAVRIGETALEHIGLDIVLLQRAHVEHGVGQAGPVLDGGDVVNALEAQVVDGENGLRVADGRVLEQRAQIHRHERRLPVVAVDDVWYPVHVVERGQRGLAEEAVPGDIVHEVQIRVAGGEELLVVDEVVDDAVVHILHDADVVVAAGVAEVHVELAAVDHLVLVLLRDAGVAGENDADVAVEPCELAWQGVHDVAQAAGLDEGVAL